MKRVLVALGLIAALALLVAALWFAFDDDGREGPPLPAPRVAAPPRPPVAETPSVKRAPPAAAAPAEVVRQAPPARPKTPPGRGRLECSVTAPKRLDPDRPCTIDVLYPAGDEIATQTTDGASDCVFENLPTGVPLVLRISAPFHLTGLCCDVVLADDRPLRKVVELRPAPVVRLRVVETPQKYRVPGVRVELRRDDDVVAEATTNESGEATFAVPVVGQLRARLTLEGFATPADAVVDVWPGDVVVERELELPIAGGTEVAVVTPSGDPAPGVDVWLQSDGANWPRTRTGRDGVASFRGVRSGATVVVVARDDAGRVGRAVATGRDSAGGRVALLLGDPAPLTGDVVDEGGSPVVGAQVEVLVHPFDRPIVVTSDAVGQFTTEGLPNGLAQVTARREGFLDWRSEKTVEIRPGVGGHVRAWMRHAPTGWVFVTVKDDAGRRVADAEVALYPSKLTGRTGAEGTCRIDGAPAGAVQTVFARRRGFHARRDAGWTPSCVRVRADHGEPTEIVLAPNVEGAAPPAPEQRVATGVLLDSAGRAVVGARVDAGPRTAFSGEGGAFRVACAPAAAPGEPIEIRVTPGPGLLEPFRCFLDFDDAGVADLGTLRLVARPYARIEVPNTDPPRSGAFWLSCNHGDALLGRASGPFQPIACVSYDFTWLHLPPADDWKTDGRGEVFVAFATPHGLLAAAAQWTLAPDAAATLRPAFVSRRGALTLENVNGGYSRGTARFWQNECAAKFDPKSIRVPTGDAQSTIDPFATLTSFRTFDLARPRSGTLVADVAPGKWRVEFIVGDLAKKTVDVVVPDETIVSFSR